MDTSSNSSSGAEEGAGAEDRHDFSADEADAILDDIDEVLEDNPEDFVRSFVRNGGQGPSGFLDPSFNVGAVSAGVAAAMTWEAFKIAVGRVVGALRQFPENSVEDFLDKDGQLKQEFVADLKLEWEMARRVLHGLPSDHSIGEARALHLVMLFREILREQRLVQLEPDHYERIVAAGNAVPERLAPRQMVARIIDQWLRKHPNSDIGLI